MTEESKVHPEPEKAKKSIRKIRKQSEAAKRPHYVNNKDFSNAVVIHCLEVIECTANKTPIPVVPNYIATCFLKISEGLSHRANFVRYTYREEMVMDAVENCLRAITRFDPEAATRSGNLNAFAYFTQIAWYAFLRRIQNEKRQQDIKIKYMSEASIESFLLGGYDDNGESAKMNQPFVDILRSRIDVVKTADTQFKEYAKEEKKRKRRAVKVDSDLSDYLD